MFSDFWTKIVNNYTQPVVTYKNQFMLHVLQNDDTFFFSSIVKLNDYYNNVLPVPLVKV